MAPSGRGMTLETKLPLLISALLVVVVSGFSWAAYRAVRQTAIAAATDRLGHVSTQLENLLVAGGAQRLGEIRALATQPALGTYVRRPTTVTRAGALEVLKQWTDRDSLNAAVELWVPGESPLDRKSVV